METYFARLGATGRAVVVAVSGLAFWTVAWGTRPTCGTCGGPLSGIEDYALIVWFAAPFLVLAAWIESDSRFGRRRIAAFLIAVVGSLFEAALLHADDDVTAVGVFGIAPLILLGTALIAGRPRTDRFANLS